VTTPPSSVGTAEVIAQLAQDLHRISGTEQTAAVVLRAGSQVIDCSHAGLVLTDDRDRLRAGPATDKIVDAVNYLQVERQLGPAPAVLAAAFDPDDVVTIQALSGHVTVALRNAAGADWPAA
jgi:hypothetical protein